MTGGEELDIEALLAGFGGDASTAGAEDHHPWAPVDLASVIEGEAEPPVPTICPTRNGKPLFYSGELNGIHGVDASGKSWLALVSIANEIRSGRGAVLVDLEDSPSAIVARLGTLGLSSSEIKAGLLLVRPEEPLGATGTRRLIEAARGADARLVVIDSLGELFGLNEVEENSDREVAGFFRSWFRPLLNAGLALVVIDHSVKAAAHGPDRLWPSGSKRKRAAMSGAAYHVEAKQPFAIGHAGRAKVTCAKDRHGSYMRGEHVADLVLDDTGRFSLDAVSKTQDASSGVDRLVSQVVETLTAEGGGPISTRALTGALPAGVGTERKRQAIELAASRGLIVGTDGPRNAKLYALPAGSGGTP